MTDTGLISRCQEGDMQAFDIIYDKFSHQALRTAFLMTGRKELAEDIVQEAFIKCFKEISKLKDPQSFKAWFYRILTNLYHRMGPKEKANVSIEEMSDKGIEIFRDSSDISNPLEVKELQHIVWSAINKLDASSRSVIVLYYFDDFTIKEIARIMKCFEGTVKSRLHYARKKLMKEISSKNVASVLWDEVDERKEYGLDAKAGLL